MKKNEVCVIDNCDNHAAYAELCHAHYQRRRLTGSVNAEQEVRSYMKGGSQGTCLYCERPASSMNLCMKHYARVHLHGNPYHERKQRALCEVLVDGEPCGKSATAHLKCRYHYDKARREKLKNK